MSGDAQGPDEDWFERVWEHREEVLYPSLFGSISKEIFPIPGNMLTGVFKQETYDARWLHHGVMEFAPTAARASWLYVTSGMSNAWEANHPDPNSVSGLGCEFVFETTQQSQWAIEKLLYLMTFQILLCHDRIAGCGPLEDYHRIYLGGPIRPGETVITHLMMAPPSGLPEVSQLESGTFEFSHVVGISAAEAAYAREHNGPALVERLIENGCFPITDPDRSEVPL